MSANDAATAARLPGAAEQARTRRILVLDDEPGMQRLMKVILEGEGYEAIVTDDGAQALEILNRGAFDLVIQDLRMPKMDGLTFLRLMKEKHPETLSIVVTAYGTWETAVEAMRLGAYTHLTKPFDTEEFRSLVARALERRELAERGSARDHFPLLDLVGNSPSMNAIVVMVKRIAPTDTTVLISGESGTGKELVARAIHYNSLRAQGPFVAVNCGAFTETLLESELFGHVKGAFTNAIADRKGLFETADRGTLFLDEIGEMSMLMQVKLLRVLETHTFKPVGGNRETRCDVRIIAATNRTLSQMCAEGEFREDLFHRLNVIPIALPPLRERPEDVPMLAGHFLARYSKRMGKVVKTITESSMRRLIAYHWPGNVRELENTIERAVALCTGDKITEGDLVGPMAAPPGSGSLNPVQLASGYAIPAVTPADLQRYRERKGSTRVLSPAGLPRPSSVNMPAAQIVPGLTAVPQTLPEEGMDLERFLLEQERAFIVQALERTGWNMTEAAKLLGMTFRSIRYRVSKLNIERPSRS
ncbi:MAG: sigma-54 dependent transcriptional regulator [Planctomycetota bacterium]|nr:sigma-54 dependent transcriptional regulator [Planctomycetota bacterium]